MNATPSSNTQIYSLEFFSGCVRLSVGTVIVYLHEGLCRLLIIFSFSFELTPNLHKALLRLILRRFFCFVFYITVQYSFSLGDGPGAARWIYSYLAFDFF